MDVNLDVNVDVDETCRRGKSEGRPTRERKPDERNETRATDEPRTTLQQQKQVRIKKCLVNRFQNKTTGRRENESIISSNAMQRNVTPTQEGTTLTHSFRVMLCRPLG
mmetsp:Transcript_22338/g.22671  ORF Transcript_22338/g.22671 Transcript_22338/m.22671 type:complete len:108 (-) Transcript_22338:384-707(-)